MQFNLSDWRICLAFLGGIALIIAALRGHLFSIDFWRGRAETRQSLIDSKSKSRRVKKK